MTLTTQAAPRRFRIAPLTLGKATYFLYFAAMGSLMPYLSLHYRAIGLSGREIGLIMGVAPFVTLFAAPMWGSLADILRQHKRILVLGICGMMCCMAGIAFARDLRLLMALVLVNTFMGSPIMALVDNTVLHLLGDDKALYGRQRVWGSVGWGAMGALMGYLTGRLGMPIAFYGYFALLILALIVALQMPIVLPAMNVSYGTALKALWRQRWWAVVLVAIFIQMMGRATAFGFLMLYLNDLQTSRAVMGLSVAVASFSDIPTYFFADRLMRRLGPRGMLYLAFAASLAVLLGYGFLRNPVALAWMQLLGGPSFSAMWVAGVHYARQAAPEGMGATTQALFGAVVWGLGSGTGNLLGGMVYDAWGGAVLFRGAALVVVAAGVFFLLAGRRVPR